MRKVVHLLQELRCFLSTHCKLIPDDNDRDMKYVKWMKDQETASRQQRRNIVSARLRGQEEDRRDDHH